jgi:uncharacterized protein
MDANDIAAWLRTHPDFFVEHGDVFAAMRLPHPEGGHAISMVERQLIALREKNTQLERRIAELIGYGQHNDVLADKLHRLTIALLRADDPETTTAVIRESVQADYRIPFVALKQWSPPTFDHVSSEMQSYVVGLDQPYAGPLAAYESREWFEMDEGTPQDLRSFAYVPLASGEVFGVLALASTDASRFTPDMAVDVLTRVGNLVSAALARFAAHAEERFGELG